MIDEILNNSVIICNNKIKESLLLELSKNKVIKNIKFMTLNDFKNNYIGTYDNNAIYYLMKNYSYDYEVAKLYLENIFYNYEVLKDLYYDLEEKKLLHFNKQFKDYINNFNIYIIGYYDIDKYLVDILNKLNCKYIEFDNNYKLKDVYEFNSLTDELNFVFQDIIKEHNNDFKDVYLVNVGSEYYSEIKRLSKLYNLKVNLKNNNIYSSKIIQDFITNLTSSNNIEDSIEKIQDNEIKNKVIDILNKYDFDEVDTTFIDLIKNELKNISIESDINENAINIIDIDDMFLKDKYYYILNFNQGVIPRIFHDDDLIPDKIKKELKLNTSYEKLLNNKNYVINVLNSFSNIKVSYKLKDNYNEYLKSPLIDELKLNIIKDYKLGYNYSNRYNEIELARMLDEYYKFNIENDNLKDLLKTYPNNKYNSYDNSYKKIDYLELKKCINDSKNISYSSMNNYYHCAFKYYIENILNLNIFDDTFMIFIGNLYHYVLSKMYDDNFNLNDVYNEYLKDKELNNKEKFFLKKLYSELEFIIHTISYQDSRSQFNKVMTEQKITIDKSDDLKINFIGFIDKIKYLDNDGKLYIAIIDYKTGNVKSSLDNINYGFNMQLPVYIYLAKSEFENANIVGFYLQKLLTNTKIDSENIKQDKQNDLKLVGYSIDDEEIIKLFDDSYIDSDVIKSMKKTSKGFSSYTKLINDIDLNKICYIVDKNINQVISALKNCSFDINPKRFNDDLIGCEYCKYSDICYKKEEDIVNIKYSKIEDILGGDDNGLD